jgi:hypothetical protein
LWGHEGALFWAESPTSEELDARAPLRAAAAVGKAGEIEVYDRLGLDGACPEVTDLVRRQVV